MRRSKILYVFDLDDTLVHHDYSILDIFVRKDDEPDVHGIIPYSAYLEHGGRLPPLARGYWYDFSDFRNAVKFMQSSQPIPQTINIYNTCMNSGDDTFILTAREQFDDMQVFNSAMDLHGITDAARFTICAGTGIPGKATPDRKKEVVRMVLDKTDYSDVVIYEDSVPNILAIKSLAAEFPSVNIIGYEVVHDKLSVTPVTFVYHDGE